MSDLREAIGRSKEQILKDRIEELEADNERLRAVEKAAKALRDDLIFRADVGTHEGDHSVQAGNTVWFNICEALAAVEGKDDE